MDSYPTVAEWGSNQSLASLSRGYLLVSMSAHTYVFSRLPVSEYTRSGDFTSIGFKESCNGEETLKNHASQPYLFHSRSYSFFNYVARKRFDRRERSAPHFSGAGEL